MLWIISSILSMYWTCLCVATGTSTPGSGESVVGPVPSTTGLLTIGMLRGRRGCCQSSRVWLQLGPPILLGLHAKSHRELCMVPLMCNLGLPSASRGSLGCKAALVRSASLDAQPLALPMLLSLALLLSLRGAGSFFFVFFSLQFGPVD